MPSLRGCTEECPVDGDLTARAQWLLLLLTMPVRHLKTARAMHHKPVDGLALQQPVPNGGQRSLQEGTCLPSSHHPAPSWSCETLVLGLRQ